MDAGIEHYEMNKRTITPIKSENLAWSISHFG